MANLDYSSISAINAAEALFSGGATIVSASLIGSDQQVATFSNGDAVADELTPADTGLIFSTGNAENATNESGKFNQKLNTSGKMKTEGSDDIAEHTTHKTFDAAGLEVTFVPDQDALSFTMTFASEEYPEYVGSIYNDMAAVYVNGELVPITGTTSGIVDVNAGDFYNNTDSSINTEFDGVVTSLSVTAKLIPGQENTIKIVIADVGDNIYDSAILIAGNAIQIIDEADLTTVTVDGTEGADTMHEEFIDVHGDTIDGDDGNADVILGYGGADDIIAGQGNDLAAGGVAGNEWSLVGGKWVYDASAIATGGSGGPKLDASDDTIHGGDGDDVVLGGGGNDQLYGDAGNDVVNAGVGDDIAYGGAGTDTLNLEDGNDYAEGGSGGDIINAGAGDDVAFGGAGDDKLRGGDGDDQLHGGEGGDVIHGGKGDDAVYGGEGDDKLFGGDGNDKLSGGAGNDHIEGGAGDDKLDGGADDDKLLGGSGDDVILGGAGADKLVGGSGSDTIEGGAGDDHMWGGNWWKDGSTDTFVVSAGGGKDMIHDFETGHDQIDLSSYGLEFSDLQSLMTNQGWATEIDLSGLDGGQTGDKILIKSIDPDDLDESNFIL